MRRPTGMLWLPDDHGRIVSLESRMTTAEGSISTLQTQMSVAQTDIASLQSSRTAYESAWSTWTPSWGSVTLGSGGSRNGYYKQIGKMVFFHADFTLGTSGGSVSGTVTLDLPVTASVVRSGGVSGMARVNSAGAVYWIGGTINSASSVTLKTVGSSGNQNINGTNPFTWAASDNLAVSGMYEAA